MTQFWRTILDADPFWHIAAWVLLVAGIVLLLWALFRDSPGWFGIPRERCPRCRYDMAGTQGEREITCPECGRVSRTRRPFRKTRRRWGFAALALMLMLGRYAAVHKDRIRAYGWHELIPTSVDVFWVDPERWYQSQFLPRDPDPHPANVLLDRVMGRLDVAQGWQRDVWMYRLKPVLDAEGTWAAYRVGDLTEYRVRFEYNWTGKGGSHHLTGPEIAWPFYELITELTILIELTTGEDWADYETKTYWMYSIGDRLIVHGPQHSLDLIEELLAELRSPVRFPESPNDALRFGEIWAIRMPLRELAANAENNDIFDDPTMVHFEDLRCVGTIEEAIMTLINTENWVFLDGDVRVSGYWRDELWILSTEDIREDVIDAAHKIAEHGPEYWIERINAEHED